jgi:hypothetical protein
LCQTLGRIGETGYYLATFEAAIEHIKILGEEEEERVERESFEEIARRKEETEEQKAVAGAAADAAGGGKEKDSGKELEKLLAGSGFLG